MISLIAGLGNPGLRYRTTRHNAGFLFLDAFAAQHGANWREEKKFFCQYCDIRIGADKLRLCKPQTFMNASGRSLAAICRFYEIAPQRVLVVHDDLDLPEGAVRLKQGGGHGGHNGLRDIIAALGSREFYRLRLGIDHPGQREEVLAHVLQAPGSEGRARLKAAIARGVRAVEILCCDGAEKAIHWLHSRTDSEGEQSGL